MTDLIRAAEEQMRGLLRAAFSAAAAKGALPPSAVFSPALSRPREPERGELSSACALAAGAAEPRRTAEALLAELDIRGSFFASAEAAGPGYLNFRLGEGWYAAVLQAFEAEAAVPAHPMTGADFLLALGADPALLERQDGENPLYRVRYAYTRLGTLLAREQAAPIVAAEAAGLLTNEAERALLRCLARIPASLSSADPARPARALAALGDAFYRWYHTHPLREPEPRLRAARLRLGAAVRLGLALGLEALGLHERRTP